MASLRADGGMETDGSGKSLAGRLAAGNIGCSVRKWYFGRKVRRLEAGRTARLRARVHRRSAPPWREERGSLVGSARSLRWRPVVRRWRGVDLTTALVVAAAQGDSVAGREDSEGRLGLPPEIDRLVVSLDAAPVVAAMTRSRRAG